uniref:Tat pathway signal protein n=1 Tax=Globodera pallida TaxID=36090 RepID=A0A183BMI3_GLOPA
MVYDPRVYGRFVPERRCTCGDSELFSIEVSRVECDFMDRSDKRACNAGRVAVGVGSAALAFIPFVGIPLAVDSVLAQAPTWGQDLTHTALEVLYKCRLCGHEVPVTYEILGQGVVRNDIGRYTKVYERVQALENVKNMSFVDIERVYRGMPKSYNFAYKNCKQWTMASVEVDERDEGEVEGTDHPGKPSFGNDKYRFEPLSMGRRSPTPSPKCRPFPGSV